MTAVYVVAAVAAYSFAAGIAYSRLSKEFWDGHALPPREVIAPLWPLAVVYLVIKGALVLPIRIAKVGARLGMKREPAKLPRAVAKELSK